MDKANYGTPIPNKIMYFCGLCIIIPVFFSFFIPLFLISLILWIVAGLFAIFLIILLYFELGASKNDNEFQHICWDFVVDKLNWDGDGRALDIGTGSGAMAIKLAKKHPSAKIQAIDTCGKTWDYSKTLCETNARIEGVADRIDFKKASAAKLPFNDEEFDAIVSNFVFHEIRSIRDKKELFAEAFRVLKKGGRFSIQDKLLSKGTYGNIEDVMETIKSWEIQEIKLIKTVDELPMPSNFIIKKFMKTSGLLCGKK
jgi:ubiquinone/menaquinone biosynthesis C-methylase UbiE